MKKNQKNTKEYFTHLLHTVGLRATPRRLIVLSFLARTSRPLTIKQLYHTLRSVQNIDIVTLYRMMDDFYRAGVVRRVDFHHGHAHFELAMAHDQHYIVCKNCGVVESVPECALDRVITRMTKKSEKFSIITDHTFELFGLCKKCVQKI